MKCCVPLALLSLSLTGSLTAFPDGPFPQLTGGFGEETCLSCHQDYLQNEGRVLGGDFQVTGVPKSYEPGRRYVLTVRLSQPGQTRWGFELSTRFVVSHQQAGTLHPLDANTQIKSAAGVDYIEHTEPGTRTGERDGPVEFQFDWTAPEKDQGPILINAAGNAANGDDSPSGDFIYTASAYSFSQSPIDAPLDAPLARENRGRTAEDPRLLHVATPTQLKRGSVSFLIQHRFLGRVDDPGNAFGVDRGANINLEINYGLTNWLSTGASRVRLGKQTAFFGTIRLAGENSSRKAGLRFGVEGQNNFQQQYSPFFEFPVQYDLGRLRLSAVPILVLNSRDDRLIEFFRDQAVNPESNNTLALGLGFDYMLTRKISIVGEYVPRLAGFGGLTGEKTVTGGGVKFRTWGHVFNVMLSNSTVLTPSGYAVGPTRNDVFLGFNIYREMKP